MLGQSSVVSFEQLPTLPAPTTPSQAPRHATGCATRARVSHDSCLLWISLCSFLLARFLMLVEEQRVGALKIEAVLKTTV